MKRGVTRELAEFCHGLSMKALPGEVVDKVKYCALDFLGVVLRGSTVLSSRAMTDFVARLGCGGDSVVMGTSMVTAPQYAALANGTSAHSLELDDVNNEASLHPGVVVFPAAFATAELMGSQVQEFITAVALGYEVMVKLGKALNPAEHYARGFHPTATCGDFAAAAITSKLLHLSTEQTVSALGIAGSQTSGLMEFLSDGAWTKRMHPGWAAHSGILAALLAREGFTGPSSIIEGRAGFLSSYSGKPDVDRVLHNLGTPFEIVRTSIKPHACCRYKQGPIDGILKLMRENRLSAQDIEQVTLGILKAGFPIIAEPEEQKRNPRSIVDAQFSMPFGAAVAILFGRASLDEYTQENIDLPGVKEMMGRVSCVDDPELERVYPQRWPATVELATGDGRRFFTRIDSPRGDPENPLSWEELIDKFNSLSSAVCSGERREEIVSRVRTLETEKDLRGLCQLLVP